MIRTLRITSVAAVLLATVVLASVLGFLQPASVFHLNAGTGGDKQIDKILSGPSAVDRFKEKSGGKVASGLDTISPLVKEATLLEGIINPRQEGPPLGQRGPSPIRPITTIKPPVISSKFDLLGICYSSDAKTSLAYIRLPDGAFQWVGLGSEIGHVTIKEIHKDSIVYADGGRDVTMPVVAPPETANLLEASDASATPEPSLPRPTLGAKTTVSPVKPAVAASPTAVTGTTVPPAQISKEEQESLSQLGNRLKIAAGADPLDRDALKSRLISEYRAAQAGATEANKVESPSEPSAGTDFSKAAASEESRQLFLKRLSKPRTNAR